MTDGALAPKRTSIEYSSSSRSMSVHRAASSRPSCGACMSRCNDMAADCQTPPNTMALGFDGCLHRQQHVKAIGGEDMKRCRGYLVVRSVCGGIFCLGKSRRYRHHFSISIVSHIHRHFARPALRKTGTSQDRHFARSASRSHRHPVTRRQHRQTHSGSRLCYADQLPCPAWNPDYKPKKGLWPRRLTLFSFGRHAKNRRLTWQTSS